VYSFLFARVVYLKPRGMVKLYLPALIALLTLFWESTYLSSCRSRLVFNTFGWGSGVLERRPWATFAAMFVGNTATVVVLE